MLVDSWDNFPFVEYCKSNIKFDYIFTFDEKDAKKHGFLFHTIPFSMWDGSSDAVEYDMYFAGSNRGSEHLNILHSVYKHSKVNDVSSIYRLDLVSKNEQKFRDIIYNKTVEYQVIVEGTQKCNCVLEVLKDNQFGATAWYCEAVCYNKKLLTNNKNVINLIVYR